MFVRHEVAYVTKRGAQLQLINEAGQETLVYVDLVRNDAGLTTGFKPKTKAAAEVEYLNTNKDVITSELTK